MLGGWLFKEYCALAGADSIAAVIAIANKSANLFRTLGLKGKAQLREYDALQDIQKEFCVKAVTPFVFLVCDAVALIRPEVQTS